MTRFHNSRVNINVSNVLIRRGEAEKDAGEIVAVKLRPVFACALDAHSRSE